MAALALYLVFLGVSCAIALVDWRRAWLLLLICGVVQDPVRKLTPGTPVVISFTIIALYACILIGGRNEILRQLRDFQHRFPTLYNGGLALLVILIVAACNGLLTYGFGLWKVPMLGLFTYLAPIPAILLGYAYISTEKVLYRVLSVYAGITALAMAGTLLEYTRFQSPILGMVAFGGMDYIRHLPGVQIRMLSGVYRGPDIMAWHAAMLTCIGTAMALRSRDLRTVLLWITVAGWGFTNCMLGGRRKAIYFVVVFLTVLLWRYAKRLRASQLLAIGLVMVVMIGVVRHLATNEETSVYTRGALTTNDEIFQRLEGGAIATFYQFGLMGAGLGTATQGARHLLPGGANVGWQEGGLGKLAIEIGLPGLLCVAVLGYMTLRLLLLLTRLPDVPGSSQFARAMLFAFLIANGATFMASAQAFTDALLSLITGFLAGCLFATAALDERLPVVETVAPAPPRQLTAPARA